MEFTNNLKKAEELDNLKTKVLKYVLYKKRTESEVWRKFASEDEILLEEVIENLKENKYIDDLDYIDRSIKEFKNLKNMSIKEVNYKLLQKGVDKKILDSYIYEHREELIEYEIKSAKEIIQKKSKSMELDSIKSFLYSKGYMSESLDIVFNE